VNGVWTENDMARLREMWLGGDSATAIGRILGRTRNAVLGKVHRAKDLPKRTSTVARPRAQKAVAHYKPRPLPARILTAEELKPANPPIYTRDLEPEHCRWPYDAPEAPDHGGYKYCGGQRSGASRYCDQHNVIAFQPKLPPKGQRDAS
jgi:GcrA cell cycle regulator